MSPLLLYAFASIDSLTLTLISFSSLSFSHVSCPFRTLLEKNDSIMAFFGTKATEVATQTPQGTFMNDQFG